MPSPLTEIGRTRSRTVCLPLREVAPRAIRLTQDADSQFGSARDTIFDSTIGDAASRPMKLRKIDQRITKLTADVLELRALLNDPRLANTDEKTMAGDEKARADLRASVRFLYDTELQQLNAVNMFVESGRMLELQSDREEETSMKAALDGIAAPPKDVPGVSRPTFFGGPPRYTNKLAMANEIDRWFGRIVSVTTRREEAVSRVIVALAAICR
jgi:hypothetical protein